MKKKVQIKPGVLVRPKSASVRSSWTQAGHFYLVKTRRKFKVLVFTTVGIVLDGARGVWNPNDFHPV